MKTNKVGQVNGNFKPKKARVCVHQRMVSCHYNVKGQTTGYVVCRECGTVILDHVKVIA